MNKIWAKIKAGRDFLIQHNILALILLIVVVLASWASRNEAARVKGLAFGGAVAAGQNAQKIEKTTQEIEALKAQVKDVADRPVPPPVVIVQKETKYEKPFTNDDMLARARKLREQQQAADNNRRK